MSKLPYLPWIALAVAVIANISANLLLKQVMVRVDPASTRSTLLQVLSSASFWLGIAAAAVLLLAYLVAIRNISVGTAYVVTTSLAMVGIVLLENRLFDVSIGPTKAVGIVLVVLGVWMISRGAVEAV